MSIKTPVGLKQNTTKCRQCNSACCKYITIRIPTPVSIQDFDGLLWQIAHRNVHIFKDVEGWYIMFLTPCTHLKKNGLCGIYEQRPNVCSDHSAHECEYDDPIVEGAELYFHDYASFDTYCSNRFKNWKKRLSRPLYG